MSNPTGTVTFLQRFRGIAKARSPLCIGLDPSRDLLSQWGLPANAGGLREFCIRTLDAAQDVIGLVKPQVAFFEAFGPDGFTVLRDMIREAQARGLMVIADAKRSDIGHSMTAYADAWVGRDSAFGPDAVTANAYLGFGTLIPLIDRAAKSGSCVFVVVRSSNPEGAELQNASTDGLSIADRLAANITDFNARIAANGGGTPVGAVVGATLSSLAERATIERLSNALFLTPGIGAQGATVEAVRKLFGAASSRVILPISRGLLNAGPDVASLRNAVERFAEAAKILQD